MIKSYPFVLVNKEYNDSVDVEWFTPDDVLMIVSDKKGGSLHYIGNNVYKGLHLTLEDYEEIWYQYGFRATDKCNVVNMNKTRYFDVSMRLLYFTEKPSSTCLSASVAHLHIALVKDLKQKYNITFSTDLQQAEGTKNKTITQGRLAHI